MKIQFSNKRWLLESGFMIGVGALFLSLGVYYDTNEWLGMLLMIAGLLLSIYCYYKLFISNNHSKDDPTPPPNTDGQQ